MHTRCVRVVHALCTRRFWQFRQKLTYQLGYLAVARADNQLIVRHARCLHIYIQFLLTFPNIVRTYRENSRTFNPLGPKYNSKPRDIGGRDG